MMTRRQAIKTTALVATASAIVPAALAQPAPAAAAPAGPFKLPLLPYAFDALEPHIDARTMEIHHDRHHKTYVDNLNKAIADWPTMFASEKYIEALVVDWPAAPEKVRDAIRNNAGGHYNHSLFWQMMKKNGGGEPKAELAKAIDASFGSLSAFKDNFTKAALNRFGSGWAWLTLNKGKLEIGSTANQNTPSMGQMGQIAGCEGAPLLGLDVWEHAYYLKYQNKRADYIVAWWNVVNWDFVAERYVRSRG